MGISVWLPKSEKETIGMIFVLLDFSSKANISFNKDTFLIFPIKYSLRLLSTMHTNEETDLKNHQPP